MAIIQNMKNVCKLFSNCTKPWNPLLNCQNVPKSIRNGETMMPYVSHAQLHLSHKHFHLMEFFDDKKNWGENEVRVGRSWRLEELRIKSNVDLHKLWYILLKERNMLLTMEHECKENYKMFPNPERLDKVEESMENLESVVRERNKAYHLLETGETGERPSAETKNCFGLNYKYKMSEHLVEAKYNTHFKKEVALMRNTDDKRYVRKFVSLYTEKMNKKKKAILRRDFNHVVNLLKRFPDMDMEALQEQYPEVDIERAKKQPGARGNRVNLWS